MTSPHQQIAGREAPSITQASTQEAPNPPGGADHQAYLQAVRAMEAGSTVVLRMTTELRDRGIALPEVAPPLADDPALGSAAAVTLLDELATAYRLYESGQLELAAWGAALCLQSDHPQFVAWQELGTTAWRKAAEALQSRERTRIETARAMAAASMGELEAIRHHVRSELARLGSSLPALAASVERETKRASELRSTRNGLAFFERAAGQTMVPGMLLTVCFGLHGCFTTCTSISAGMRGMVDGFVNGLKCGAVIWFLVGAWVALQAGIELKAVMLRLLDARETCQSAETAHAALSRQAREIEA